MSSFIVLHQSLHGVGSFKVGGREFDGALGNVWWEAKSGQYWSLLDDSEAFKKFQQIWDIDLKLLKKMVQHMSCFRIRQYQTM